MFLVDIRVKTPADQASVKKFIKEQWGADLVVAKGEIYQPSTLPGFIAEYDERLVGLVTYRIDGESCEIVTIDATHRFQGVGTMLLEAVITEAQNVGCRRLWLVTTNDNLPALRFYQRRGFELVAVYPHAVEKARALKAQVPRIGIDGIPIRDEIELEMMLVKDNSG